MKGSRPLTDEEIRQAVASFSGRYAARDRAIFALSVNTGLRISEMLSIRFGDILHQGQVVSDLHIQRRFMKRRYEGRIVYVNVQAREALGIWVQELRGWRTCAPETFLFQSQARGNRPISISQAWRVLDKVYRRLGFHGRLGTHAGRKTYAARVKAQALRLRDQGLLQEDVIRVVSRALGHRDIATTENYLSFEEDIIRRINDTLTRPETTNAK